MEKRRNGDTLTYEQLSVDGWPNLSVEPVRSESTVDSLRKFDAVGQYHSAEAVARAYADCLIDDDEFFRIVRLLEERQKREEEMYELQEPVEEMRIDSNSIFEIETEKSRERLEGPMGEMCMRCVFYALS